MSKKSEKGKFDQTKYTNEWKKQNMSMITASYKTEFVQEFREACKILGVSQSSLIRSMMEETIEKAKHKGNKALTYYAVFHVAEEGGYSVEVPDLPGCISEGDTLAEAIDMITDAASGWVLDELEDGKDLPMATSLEVIQKQYKEEIVKPITLNFAKSKTK